MPPLRSRYLTLSDAAVGLLAYREASVLSRAFSPWTGAVTLKRILQRCAWVITMRFDTSLIRDAGSAILAYMPREIHIAHLENLERVGYRSRPRSSVQGGGGSLRHIRRRKRLRLANCGGANPGREAYRGGQPHCGVEPHADGRFHCFGRSSCAAYGWRTF
jgi:hypothetical protein